MPFGRQSRSSTREAKGSGGRKIHESAGHFLKYGLGTATAALLALLQGVLLRKQLGPSEFGTYQFLTTLLTYFSFTHLGTILAAERDIPIKLAENDRFQLGRIINNSITSSLLFTLLFTVLILPIATNAFINTFVTPAGIYLTFTILFFQQVVNSFETVARGNRNFNLISNRIFLSALLSLILTLTFSYYFQLTGALSGLFLATLIMAVFYLITFRRKWGLEFEWPIVKKLLMAGLPILISGLFYTALSNADLVFIYLFLGSESAGYYSLAPLFFMVVNLTPRVLGIVIYPRLLYQYAQNKNDDVGLRSRVLEALSISTTASTFVMGIVYISATPIISQFLPHYLPGLQTGKLVLLFSTFLSVIPLQGFYLIAKKNMKSYLFILSVGLSLAIVGMQLLPKTPSLFISVPLLMGATSAITCFLMYTLINRGVRQNIATNILGFLRITYPILLGGFTLLLTDYASRIIQFSVVASIFLQLSFFGLVFIFPLLKIYKRVILTGNSEG